MFYVLSVLLSSRRSFEHSLVSGYDLHQPLPALPDPYSLTRIRERYGLRFMVFPSSRTRGTPGHPRMTWPPGDAQSEGTDLLVRGRGSLEHPCFHS